jgi:hypothetical protein
MSAEGDPLKKKTLRAAGLHYAQSIFRAYLVLHSIKMILDGLLRETEVVGDFLVCKTFRDQGDQLLLPSRQSQSLRWTLALGSPEASPLKYRKCTTPRDKPLSQPARPKYPPAPHPLTRPGISIR